MINSPKIIKWCSVNCHINMHEKLQLIPIGLNYHCEGFWGKPKMLPLDQEKILEDIKKTGKHFSERIKLCYSTFHFAQHKAFGNDRKQAMAQIPKNLMVYEKHRLHYSFFHVLRLKF